MNPFSVELAKELPVNLALMILITDSIAIFNRKDSIDGKRNECKKCLAEKSDVVWGV
jgi:hypothetical protein